MAGLWWAVPYNFVLSTFYNSLIVFNIPPFPFEFLVPVLPYFTCVNQTLRFLESNGKSQPPRAQKAGKASSNICEANNL